MLGGRGEGGEASVAGAQKGDAGSRQRQAVEACKACSKAHERVQLGAYRESKRRDAERGFVCRSGRRSARLEEG